mmetsp:Transcript_22365/g.37407  ORF Transcript_22365/g.37407 Transcript_22365/m.37407 type:complete len:185 (+) Transcript_22365:56-610(+)
MMKKSLFAATRGIRRVSSTASPKMKIPMQSTMSCSTLPHHHNLKSNAPLIENYRSSWPDPIPDKPAHTLLDLPKRTVPDKVLRFQFTANFSSGGSIFYSHLKTNPADFKVIMKVSLSDLPLDGDEKLIFVRMVGKRLNVGNQELKLTSDIFPDRLENRKYLILQLEKLLAEAKRLNNLKDNYVL